MSDKQFPEWIDLLTLYMESNFKDKICVVFSNPRQIMDTMKVFYPDPKECLQAVSAEYAILPCANYEEATHICNEVSKKETYVCVFKDGKLTHENT